ncbi:alpha/beta hydrolase fold domain-containing protein [Novosphingobium colocasiae]
MRGAKPRLPPCPPEHPFPAAADDCLAALEWLHREHATLDIDPARIVVRGISAGGGLAAGLALRARARGNLPIALLQLIYPMLDDRCDPPAHVGEHVWTRRANLYGWASLLGGRGLHRPVVCCARARGGPFGTAADVHGRWRPRSVRQ